MVTTDSSLYQLSEQSIFEIKSSIESKNYFLLFLNWTLRRQLISEYAKSTLEISLTYLFAFMSRSNQGLVKSRWNVTPQSSETHYNCVVGFSYTVSTIRYDHICLIKSLSYRLHYYFLSLILTFLNIFHPKAETSAILLTQITTWIKFLTIHFHLILQNWILTLQVWYMLLKHLNSRSNLL